MLTRTAAALAATAALALGAPAAHATHTYVGGCGFDTVEDRTEEIARPNDWVGVLYTVTVVTSPPGADATMTCDLRVNGVSQTSATFTGTAVVTGATGVRFHAEPTDAVSLCEILTVDGHTSTECAYPTTSQMPPQELWDFVGAVGGLFNDVWQAFGLPAALVADAGSGAYYHLNSRAHCAGLLAGPDRYVVHGVSETYSPHATGSTISCWIKDRISGATYGPVDGVPVGAQSVALGTVDAPVSPSLVMCAESYVSYDDRPTSHYRTPGC